MKDLKERLKTEIHPEQEHVRPSHFIGTEGDEWEPWTGPESISTHLLADRRLKKAVNQQYVWIHGIQVHALRFNGARWDCYNGWTERPAWT